MSVGEAARDLRTVFEREGVRWYLFGAQAVMVHGKDVRGLLAAGGVDNREVRSLLGQLEEALGQSDRVANGAPRWPSAPGSGS